MHPFQVTFGPWLGIVCVINTVNLHNTYKGNEKAKRTTNISMHLSTCSEREDPSRCKAVSNPLHLHLTVPFPCIMGNSNTKYQSMLFTLARIGEPDSNKRYMHTILTKSSAFTSPINVWIGQWKGSMNSTTKRLSYYCFTLLILIHVKVKFTLNYINSCNEISSCCFHKYHNCKHNHSINKIQT